MPFNHLVDERNAPPEFYAPAGDFADPNSGLWQRDPIVEGDAMITVPDVDDLTPQLVGSPVPPLFM